MVTFPTSSTALIQLKDGDYNIIQLAKTVDQAVKAQAEARGESVAKDKDADGEGGEDFAAGQPGKLDRSVPGQPASEIGEARPGKLVHLHTLALEISLAPPKAQIRRHNAESQRQEQVPNPDRERFDAIRDTAQTNFEPATPFTLIPTGDKALALPVDKRGSAVTKSTGFQVLLPSNVKRVNVTPFLKRVVYPYDQYSKEWFVSTNTWDTVNWIHAAIALDPRQASTRKGNWRPEHQKVFLTSDLKGCWIPHEVNPDAPGELKLILTIDAHIDLDHLFDPSHEIANDLMGLILHSLVPSPTSLPPMSDSERRADALQHFFSTVRPAPPVPYARSLQPSDMVSKLLPFQNRTVALLVQRERAEQQAVQAGRDGSWTAILVGETTKLAYNRLTGQLVKLADIESSKSPKGKGVDRTGPHGFTPSDRERLSTLVDLSGVRGTMLCEEMGLGKTVEAIALLLLNRHPLSTKRVSETSKRHPDNCHLRDVRRGLRIPTINLARELDLTESDELVGWWHREKNAFKNAVQRDDAAELGIAQVAATLIVTPPSLLKQWVAEMAVHAPHLRVCVYEGWKGLLDGVHQRTVLDTRLRKERVTAQAKRKRDNERQRAKTVKKYQKGSEGQAIKNEEDVIDDDDEETPEEDLQSRTQRLFVDFVRAHDVVITTYGELSKDLTVALRAPPRSRRSNVNYRTGDRPRSPLVMVEWWRVLMDEVQLCGDSSGAANMVSLIPRQNSLAVSGTPAKTDIKDLMGSLKFLRVPVLLHEPRLWHRMQQAPMRPAFDNLFQSIAVRTTKKEVSGEFNLPHQTRFVIPIELSEIEMHYYNDTLERQRILLGLPPDPNEPRPEDWYLDTVLFRSCLQNLRQICTHIQVGQMAGGPGGRVGRDRARLRLGRELMTSAEALTRISEDHEVERMLTSRAQLRAMIHKAQLMVMLEGEDRNNRAILALYERVRDKVKAELEPVRQHMADLLKNREAAIMDEDDDSEDGEKQLSQQQRDLRSELQHTRQTIRELLLILHQSYFFEGDARHVLEESGKEVACYEQAEETRKEILARSLRIANTSVDVLQRNSAVAQAVQSVDDLQTDETNWKAGILSHDPINQSNELLKIMNENALLIQSWRSKIMALLTTPIDQGATDLPSAAEDQNVADPEKEQYAEALKAQGEVEAYLIAYSSAIADRREMMLEERSTLAQHDARVKKLRTTKAAAQALADSDIPPDVPDDVAQLAGELMTERQTMRDAREIHDCQKPLKQMLMSLNNIVHGGARPEEVVIAKHAADWLRGFINKQTEHLEKLNKELDVFRRTFNRRVIYFAALQEISDSVTAPDIKANTTLKDEITKSDHEIVSLEAVLARAQIRGRYLKFLASRDAAENIHDDCLICIGSSDDTHGIFLECGHFFCDTCFAEFRKSALGSKCPQCRTIITPSTATRFKMGSKPVEAAVAAGAVEPVSLVTDGPVTDPASGEKIDSAIEPVPALPDVAPAQLERELRQVDLDRLNTMSPEDRRGIAMMDMMGDYGSKINFLIKHLLWYRIRDASARHVVFSNWSDSLRIVIQALQANGIKHVSFDRGGRLGGDVVEKFQQDESITVFLLHAERESAGLTLTSCRVVHLLEPVLKHSFELQAIGRVDRLGQKEETTVYCYATQDTVESRILSQGVRNGTSIYLKEEEQGDQVVEDLDNVVGAAHKGGDIGLDGNEQEMLQLIML